MIQSGDSKERAGRRVSRCDFRASGLLSNESVRHLRSLHETFARGVAHSLDLFLGSPLEVKLSRIDQVGAREFGTTLAAGSYLVPLNLQPSSDRVIVKFENQILFPLLDLLLGGPGDPAETTHELTDLDEELLRSVTELLAAQLERTWKFGNITFNPLPSLKPASIGQLFALEERVVVLQFEIRLTSTASSFSLVLPMTLCSALIRNSNGEAGGRVNLPDGTPHQLRERVLHCEMPLTVQLTNLRVPIRSVLALEVGTVLQLNAPVQSRILLATGGFPLFEVSPVRRGDFKAAQLTRSLIAGR